MSGGFVTQRRPFCLRLSPLGGQRRRNITCNNYPAQQLYGCACKCAPADGKRCVVHLGGFRRQRKRPCGVATGTYLGAAAKACTLAAPPAGQL
ncbi:hypothetical protein SORBI_3001G100650 [Sorghum bicolor]|uniref:Uncharacterized protein n=1 Tax=Sorghum bicolor TaxID=4558 RepID=A0A1Z5S531_SORBI|nr:hypothetical protein SORBI_3001G100650 [Sorghum bicolor]